MQHKMHASSPAARPIINADIWLPYITPAWTPVLCRIHRRIIQNGFAKPHRRLTASYPRGRWPCRYSRPLRRVGDRRNLACDSAPSRDLGATQIICGLQIQPELRRGPKIARESQGGIRSDASHSFPSLRGNPHAYLARMYGSHTILRYAAYSSNARGFSLTSRAPSMARSGTMTRFIVGWIGVYRCNFE